MDQLIGVLIEILWWPYEAWKRSLENSRMGASKYDQETLRFWKWVAIAGTGVLLLLGMALMLFLWRFR
jgi:hypothetical protein